MRNRRNWKDRPRATGYEVHVPEGDDATRYYKKLKKRMTKDGFFQELRERSYFTSKGEKRRKAKAAGRRRYLKKIEKRQAELGY